MSQIYYVLVPYGETVNVRSEPNPTSDVLFTLPRGAQVTRWGTFGSTDGSGRSYYGIKAANGNDGFIESIYLTSSPIDAGDPWIGRYGSTVWKKNLHSGTSYSEVANIQRDLRTIGYTSITNADGYYGSITEAAVKRFQSNHGLTSDGYCGNLTKEKLWNHPDR